MVVLTVKEVAETLRLSVESVYSKAQSGALPFFKVGRVYRMEREVLQQWLKEQSRGKRQ